MAAQRDTLCGNKGYPLQPLNGMERTINNFREVILEKDPQPVNPPYLSKAAEIFLTEKTKTNSVSLSSRTANRLEDPLRGTLKSPPWEGKTMNPLLFKKRFVTGTAGG